MSYREKGLAVVIMLVLGVLVLDIVEGGSLISTIFNILGGLLIFGVCGLFFVLWGIQYTFNE